MSGLRALRPLLVLGCHAHPVATPGDAVYATDVVRAAPVDTLVDVGGHRLHVRVYRGTAPVTVLFEAGGAADLESWNGVPERLAAGTEATIVEYDRAGLGQSDLGPGDLAPRDEVDGIRTALRGLEAPERTIIVAHSYGAMLALDHAARYPEHVMALVLVDPMNPRFVAEVGDWLYSTMPDIAEPQTNREHAIVRMASTMAALSETLRAVEPTLEVPMTIISAGTEWWGVEEIDDAWRRSHEAMAAASLARERIVSEGSGHDIPGEDPQTIVSTVRALVPGKRTSSHRPLPCLRSVARSPVSAQHRDRAARRACPDSGMARVPG